MKAHLVIKVGMCWSPLILLLASCNYYKQRNGYLVTRAEYVTHHYEGVLCREAEYDSDSCDLHEVRYTLVHQEILTIASCQAWDKFNKCGTLSIGNAYGCNTVDFKNGTGAPAIDCRENGVLKIESSEAK